MTSFFSGPFQHGVWGAPSDLCEPSLYQRDCAVLALSS